MIPAGAIPPGAKVVRFKLKLKIEATADQDVPDDVIQQFIQTMFKSKAHLLLEVGQPVIERSPIARPDGFAFTIEFKEPTNVVGATQIAPPPNSERH